MQIDDPSRGGSSRKARAEDQNDFPILLPNYPLDGDVKPNKDWGSCLLYIEGISVVVVVHGQKPSSGIANIRGAGSPNKFNFQSGYVSCPSGARKEGEREQTLKYPSLKSDFSFLILHFVDLLSMLM